MRFALTFLILSLLLTACSRQDSKIVGTWKDGKGWPTVYSPDGSFMITRGMSTNAYWFSGTWQIHNGILSETITNCSNTNYPLMGEVVNYHIVRLDEHNLEIERASPIGKLRR